METMFSNGMCRCCASEGTFKDLSTKYRWMGVDEVYSDMLQECFNVTLSTPEDSPEGGICEVCITQLRNAANFRKQVLNTEEQFKRMIQNKAFKSNIVKVEVNAPDDELPLTDEDNNLSNDDFSSTEYDLPIKTESSEEGKSRKRSAKAGPSRSKQPKLEGESSTKRSTFINTEAYLKDETDKVLQEIEEEIFNKIRLDYVTALLQYSTVLPFKVSSGYKCFYCKSTFRNMDRLSDHTREHGIPDRLEIDAAMIENKASFIPVNVFNLECRICDDIIRDDLYDLEEHLSQKHDIDLPEIEEPVVVPFKIVDKMFNCALCDKEFDGYHHLSCHMNEHFPNYKCEICGAGFLAPEYLESHKLGHSNTTKRGSTYVESKYKDIVKKDQKTVKGVVTRSRSLKKVDEDDEGLVGLKDLKKEENQLNQKNVKGLAQEATTKKNIKTRNRVSQAQRMKSINNAVTLIKNSKIVPFTMNSGFRCFYCKRYFGYIHDLEEHTNLKHTPKETFLRRKMLMTKPNQILKVNVVNVDCRLCDDFIKDFEDLKIHLRDKHRKDIDVDDNLLVPFKITNGVFECAFCGETHPGCHSLSKHMNVHYRNYICEECGKGFLTASRLSAHKQTHQSHSTPCTICKKTFKYKSAMLNHRKIVHKGHNSFKCPHCVMTFTDYYARVRHERTVHNLEAERYKCGFCDRVFFTKGHLGKHIKHVHMKEKNYHCTDCVKKYTCPSKLKIHIMNAHGVRHKCRVCQKVFAGKKSLSLHMRQTHPGNKLVCGYCDKEFVLKSTLVSHVKMHERFSLTPEDF